MADRVFTAAAVVLASATMGLGHGDVAPRPVNTDALPDVAEEYGDEWYMECYRYGYTQNGITKRPAFEDLLGQKAGSAIRTYIEARPDDGALDAATPRLKEIRDVLILGDGDFAALQAELAEIASSVETGSGAPWPTARRIARRTSWQWAIRRRRMKR